VRKRRRGVCPDPRLAFRRRGQPRRDGSGAALV